MHNKLQLSKFALYLFAMAFISYIECNLVRVDKTEDGIQCSAHCIKNISDHVVCNKTTGECTFGCADGYAEPHCTMRCSENDVNCKSCRIDPNTNGVVCKECPMNFYRSGGKCLSCNYWCLMNSSIPTATCRESDGYCNSGCKPGRYGFMCGNRCSSTCKDRCDRSTGECSDCRFPSYCGPKCQIQCQDGCSLQQCNQSCSCTNGCTTTHWGEKCSNLCNANCNAPTDVSVAICDKINGTCLHGCKNNAYWGTQCQYSCSINCLNGTCYQLTGSCIGGCLIGQYYDDMCTRVCTTKCVNGTCDENGICDIGCIDGWYGKMCDKQCSEHCFDRVCNRSDGTCLNACQSGWYGHKCGQQCSDSCLDGTCDKATGNCSNGYGIEYKGPILGGGSVCFKCDDMSSPQYCDSLVHCRHGEKCFLESHIVRHGKIFRSGCMEEQRCNMLQTSNSSSVCVQCCNGHTCNNIGCGNNDFPTREHRGPMCLDCHHSGGPVHCDSVTLCSRDQVCLIEKFQWGDDFHFKQGCVHQVCSALSYHKRSIPLCRSCCDKDFCNWNCTSDASNNGEIFVG
ncbi:multiple epidermal growth factor-like domains protein 10 [Ruditapes philippinarum]|uniref:multiple epidermal growth factor-like domains protein 10 n=1 Tax=Ruditapes philippinarum TaxID=129788 RepID=UPI00295BB4E9|nr:multiple epidermal growth factor-like domains protein 10 [Ruditapes philippinarum]